MANKKQKASKAKKTKRAARKAPKPARKMSRSAKLKKQAKKLSKKAKERRRARRIPTRNLWVTELSGDYQFVLPVENISEGGIFLRGRVKTSRELSTLRIHFGLDDAIEVQAEPLYDRPAGRLFGIGYRFIQMSAKKNKELRHRLRDLD